MTTPITPAQQNDILSNIRTLVPDGARSRAEKRHALVLGAVLALQAIDHGLVPPHWLMNVMAGSSDRLFREPQPPKAEGRESSGTSQV